MFFSNERGAILACAKAGEAYGYGNMIMRLRAAWALSLYKNYPQGGLKTALLGALYSLEEINSLMAMTLEDALNNLHSRIPNV